MSDVTHCVNCPHCGKNLDQDEHLGLGAYDDSNLDRVLEVNCGNCGKDYYVTPRTQIWFSISKNCDE